MNTRPWMSLYVGDYIADTGHLKAAEHGAYLLLIMHYWRTGGLPDDDAQLARIARMTAAEWRKARPIVEPFFQPGWKHKRIEFELTEAARISEAGRTGGKASGAARRSKVVQRTSNDTRTIDERPFNDQPTKREALHSQSPSEAKASGVPPPSDPKVEYFKRGRQVFGASSGGLLSKLLKLQGNEDDPKAIAKARARVEDASTKANPAEWIGRVLNGAGQSDNDFRTNPMGGSLI